MTHPTPDPPAQEPEASDLDLLHAVGSRFAVADPFHAVLGLVVDVVTALVKCDSCFIYVLEDENLVLRASKTPHPDVVDRLKIRVGKGITGWVAEPRQPVAVSTRAAEDPRFQIVSTLGFLVGTEIELARLEAENNQLSERLEERKLIDRAKGILQRDLGISEEEAYVTIQRQSRQRRRSKRQIAEAIIFSDEVRLGRDRR